MSAKPKRGEKRKAEHKDPTPGPSGVTAHGWTILAHPLFIDQIEKLVVAAERELATGGPYPNRKLLGHLLDLAFDKIPQDPASKQFRQGKSLGPGHTHWARAKTGNGRYRLFFRFSSSARAILYAWVNDEQSLRTYGAKNDAYAVFAKMLAEGTPPDDWNALVKAASEPSIGKTLKQLADRLMPKRGR